MVSTYHLVKFLQNAYSRKAIRKRIKQPDTNKIKCVTAAAKHRLRPETPKVIIQTCRVCLQQGTIPIFSKNKWYDFPLSHHLKLICGIDLHANDIYPQHLCKLCLDTLDAAIIFRKTAKETEIKLKEIESSRHNFNNSYNETDSAVENMFDVPLLSPQQERKDFSEPKETKLNLKNADNTKVGKRFQFTETDLLEYNTDTPNLPPQQYNKIIAKNIQYEKYYKQVFTKENKLMFQCQICKKVYSKLSLPDHLITHLPDSVYRYVCEVCGKTFKKDCSFRQHQTIHSDVLPFKCSLCPYRGRYKEQLKGHINRIHERVYNYRCTLCPKKFTNSNALRRHLLRHDEPKFQCTACHKSFYDKSMLKDHNAVNHMGDSALHKCDICGNSYKRRKNLLVHQIKAHKRKKVYNNRATYLKLVEHHEN